MKRRNLEKRLLPNITEAQKYKPDLIIKCSRRYTDETISAERERIMKEYGGNVVMINEGYELVDRV